MVLTDIRMPGGGIETTFRIVADVDLRRVRVITTFGTDQHILGGTCGRGR